jgi:hypothetical protein
LSGHSADVVEATRLNAGIATCLHTTADYLHWRNDSALNGAAYLCITWEAEPRRGESSPAMTATTSPLHGGLAVPMEVRRWLGMHGLRWVRPAQDLPMLATIPRSGTWFLRYAIAFLCYLERGGRVRDRVLTEYSIHWREERDRVG